MSATNAQVPRRGRPGRKFPTRIIVEDSGERLGAEQRVALAVLIAVLLQRVALFRRRKRRSESCAQSALASTES